MKKSEMKLIILEIIAIVIILLNIFIKNMLNEYVILLFLTVMFLISLFIVGFERDKNFHKKSVMKSVTFYTICFLILMYGLGLFTGYIKNPYSLRFSNIIKNIFPITMLIFIVELFRFHLCKKGENKRIIIYLSTILFTLVDIITLIHLYDFSNLSKILELITVVVIPSVSKNIMLTDFSYNYGYVPCLIYQLVMNLYVYLLPIIPDYDIYLKSVIMFLIPILIRLIINSRFRYEDEENNEDRTNKHIFDKIISFVFLIVIVVTIVLYSNLFPLWIAVIGSGSMTPTINVGDAIIVDKTITNDLSRLAVGDILVFHHENSIYTHRIVKIEENNGLYYISTKGDRKENVMDLWTVTNEDIIGIVKFRIPYVGYPTVWLNNILEESKR